MLLPSNVAERIVRACETNEQGKPRLKVYINQAGQKVIAFGHVLGSVNVQPVDFPLSYDRAFAMLRADLLWARNQLQKLVHARLDQHHVDALACWTLHVAHGTATNGQEDWANSQLLDYVNKEQFALAGSEFLNWSTAGGKLDSKTLRRRQMEKKVFATAEL